MPWGQQVAKLRGTAQAAAYLGLNIHAFRRIAQDDNISRSGSPKDGWTYTCADLDA